MTVVARTRARYKTFVVFVNSFAAQAGSRTGVQFRLLPRRQGLRGVTKPNVCLHTVPESKQTNKQPLAEDRSARSSMKNGASSDMRRDLQGS